MIPRHANLTPVEHQVARAIVRGESPSAAAARLQISEARFHSLVQKLQKKTGASSHHELVSLLTTGSLRQH